MNRALIPSFFALFLLSSAAFAALPIPTDSPLNLYLSADGNDANSGLSQATPLKTLSSAQSVLKAFNPAQNVIINVAPGTYFNQSVTWNWVRPDYALMIRGVGETKPVFDGCEPATVCTPKTFFILNSRTGLPSNVTLDNLQIQRYWMAVSLNGNYKAFGEHNWNNTISNNVFMDIGNGYAPNLPYSYAAIRLYNSRNNTVTKNTFKNVINVAPYAAYIHAVYAASWASSNAITYNLFENVSGDVVRIRDNSNYNWVGNNIFKNAGIYALASDWYCTGTDCDKIECPSWENRFDGNSYGLNFSLKNLRQVYASGSNVAAGCSPPTPTSPRIKSLNSVFSLK